MRLVVADTSPVFYLLSIGQVDLLPRLFGKILIPDAVCQELTHPNAPPLLRQWANQRPEWLEVVPVVPADDALRSLGAGERDAIALAISLRADLILLTNAKEPGPRSPGDLTLPVR
jgi:predicted nucleic acid-binding protein